MTSPEKKARLAADAPVAVTLDGERSYNIEFKPIAALGSTLAGLRKPGKCVVVSNTVVGPLHAKAVLDALRAGGWDPAYVEIPDGEENKTPEVWVKLVEDLLDAQVDRKTPLIGLGGGVTTDIVGFAAASALRGMPFANVPTSLLAMVDASVGGKTGVNTKQGKNLLGAFWQPCLVLVSVEVLATLSSAELRCGLGEVVKHAVLEETADGKPSTEFFEWLEANGTRLVERDPDALQHAIRRCCEIKAQVVSEDERESGKRALLNLGHTVAHAIEAVMGYGQIRHGEAVGIGMVAEARLAVERKAAPAELPGRIARLLKLVGLPYVVEGLDVDKLMAASLMDKKREEDMITITVPHAIGDVRLVKVRPQELRSAFVSLPNETGLGM